MLSLSKVAVYVESAKEGTSFFQREHKIHPFPLIGLCNNHYFYWKYIIFIGNPSLPLNQLIL